MADEYNGSNGSGGVVFTNVRILDGTGEYPYTGEVTVQGNRIKQVTKGSSRHERRRRHGRPDGHRRHGRDADARPLRRPSAPFLEQCAGHRSHPDDAARGAHARHRANGEARARCRLHHGLRRRRGQAAPRRRRSQRHQQRHDPGPALSRGGPGNHDRRRARRFRALAYPARGPQPRHRRFRPRGSAPHRAHADQIRRRFHQAQSLRRGDHRHEGGGNADVGRGSRDGGARRPRRAARCSPPTRARPARSFNACATASRTSTTPRSPTRRRSTCWRRTRTSISSRPASPG